MGVQTPLSKFCPEYETAVLLVSEGLGGRSGCKSEVVVFLPRPLAFCWGQGWNHDHMMEFWPPELGLGRMMIV